MSTSHDTVHERMTTVVTGVDFYCIAALQAARHVLLFIIPTTPGEGRAESSFGRVSEIDPATVLMMHSNWCI